MKLKVPVLVLVALTSACAGLNPSQQGSNLMNQGNYQAAYDTLSACAQAGDPYCMNNLGVMYDRGYMAGGRDVSTAAQYYTLAARYGVPIAQQNLIALGRPVPAADLQAAYQQRSIQQQQAASELGYQLGCALAGGCGQPSTAYTPPPVYPTAPTTNAPKTVAPAGCNSNYDCGYGNQCVKPAGTYGQGQCVTPVDSFGNKTYELPPLSVGPREVSSCSFNTQCPIGFRCKKEGGDLYGLCIK